LSLGPALLALLLLAALPAWGSNLQICDDTGQAAVLARPAERIIALYGAYNEILAEMGMLDRLVGRTKADTEPPEILAKPSIGTHMRPNVEMILGLKPDLIIQDAGAQDAMPGLDQLKQQGVPVAVFHPETFKDLFSVIQRLGVLTGETGRAAALTAKLQGRLAAVAARLANIKDRPRVFFEIRYPNLLGAGAASLVNDIIAHAGGVNCLTMPKKIVRLNLEAVIAADPDVYLVQQGPMNPNPEKVSERPNYTILRAVRADRVLVVPEQIYSRPSPRAVAAVAQLAQFLHPASFPEGKP
jgi:iron complex transport system substrate-binding protein